jgi:hypothetical protein
MFATKVRNPQDKLLKDVQHFFEAPKERAKRIVRIGRQEGYDFVKAAALGLLEMSKEADDMEAYHYAALLTQPQWTFHKTEDPNVVAVVVDDGEEELVIAKHTTQGEDSGDIELVLDPEGIRILEPVSDPRDAYASSHIKQKVYRMGKKYYLVDCAKDILYLQHFYSDDRIQPTRKPGYLWRFAAFVVTDGPFKTKQEAKEAQVKLHEEK